MKRVIISIILSLALVYLALRGIQFENIAELARRVQMPYLLLTLVMMFLAQLLRSIRWGTILKPLSPVDLFTLFSITSVGCLGILVAPVHLGELVRPLLISRKKDVSIPAALGTVCVERMADILTALLMTVFLLPWIPFPPWLVRTVSLITILSLTAVAGILLLAAGKNSQEGWRRLLPSSLRGKYTAKIAHQLGRFTDGFSVITEGKLLVRLIILSFSVWLTHVLAIYALFVAFGFSLTLPAACVLMFGLSAGFAIPRVPVLPGTGHYACILALSLFGLDKTGALSFAVIYHTFSLGTVVVLGLVFLPGIVKDTWDELERDVLNLCSMVFGNAVGLVEIRRGKLYQRKDVLSDIHNRIKSGDILLDKTPFRLTDKLIPGYWGHAAVWIGTEPELQAMGIWDHPEVIRYHGAIRKGRMVVEALRSGVEMNTLEHFLNIDSIGILRKPDQDNTDRARTIIQALRQVGKPYDFNFEVESRSRVYCSKLVYLSYASMEWPTRKSLGRATITPDDVATPAAINGKLELVSFYHDGRRIDDRPTIKMAELMRLEVN